MRVCTSLRLQVYGHCLPSQQADAAAAVAKLVDGPNLRAV